MPVRTFEVTCEEDDSECKGKLGVKEINKDNQSTSLENPETPVNLTETNKLKTDGGKRRSRKRRSSKKKRKNKKSKKSRKAKKSRKSRK